MEDYHTQGAVLEGLLGNIESIAQEHPCSCRHASPTGHINGKSGLAMVISGEIPPEELNNEELKSRVIGSATVLLAEIDPDFYCSEDVYILESGEVIDVDDLSEKSLSEILLISEALSRIRRGATSSG